MTSLDIFCQKINLNRAFFYYEMTARKVIIFPEKNLNGLFFILTSPTQNKIVYIDERQTLKIIPKIC